MIYFLEQQTPSKEEKIACIVEAVHQPQLK